MKKAKRYSKKENNIIIKYVTENPQNLSAAFKLAAEEIDRKDTAIAQHYYGVLRKKRKNLFLLTSGKTTTFNSKVGGTVEKDYNFVQKFVKKLFKL